MLSLVLGALLLGTFAAFGASFTGSFERDAAAAVSAPVDPAVAPSRTSATARDEAYIPMSRKTASLLLYSVLRSSR
jgi:hypothetical protein